AAERLGEGADLPVEALFQDGAPDLRAALAPALEWRVQPPLPGERDAAGDRGPAHELGGQEGARAPPHPPDAGVFLLPPRRSLLPEGAEQRAGVGGRATARRGVLIGGTIIRHARMKVQVGRDEHFPIDVELELLSSAIPDAHGARAAVAVEVIEEGLGELAPTV